MPAYPRRGGSAPLPALVAVGDARPAMSHLALAPRSEPEHRRQRRPAALAGGRAGAADRAPVARRRVGRAARGARGQRQDDAAAPVGGARRAAVRHRPRPRRTRTCSSRSRRSSGARSTPAGRSSSPSTAWSGSPTPSRWRSWPRWRTGCRPARSWSSPRAANPHCRSGGCAPQGELVELRAKDLAMTRSEAARLLQGAGLTVGPDDVVTLVRRTEGWPAGLALAATAALAAADPAQAIRRFTGANRLVADYYRDEVLAGLGAEQIRFLTHASVPRRAHGTRLRRHARLSRLGRRPPRSGARERAARRHRPVRQRVPPAHAVRGDAERRAAAGRAGAGA